MIELTTKDELIGFLMQYKSVANVTIISRTSLKMNKKDVATKTIQNPTSEAFKVSMFTAEINASYEDKVNDQRLMEARSTDFEAKDATWGEFVSKSLDKKGDDYYVKMIPSKSIIASTYEDADGNKIEFDVLAPFVPVAAKPKPAEETHQGTEKEVPFRKFKIDSIIGFQIPGVVNYVAKRK